MEVEERARTFKTAWFSKAARKARIGEDELCEAAEGARKGQSVDLGGGVFKKRLNKNMHRSIILARGGRFWIFQFLFAKNAQENIDNDDLNDFRALAAFYSRLSEERFAQLIDQVDLVEICHAV